MKCKKCDEEFEPKKGLKNYCSLKCRNSREFSDEAREKKSLAFKKNFEAGLYKNMGANLSEKYKTNPEINESKSLALRQLYKNEPERIEVLRSLRKGKNHSIETKKKMSDTAIERFRINPELHPNRRCAGIKESFPEKMFRQYIEMLGLKKGDYIQQFKIDKYFVDFYFPKINTVVEIDGEHWHKDIVKELFRENIIKSFCYKMIRFNALDIIQKKKEDEIKIIIAAFA